MQATNKKRYLLFIPLAILVIFISIFIFRSNQTTSSNQYITSTYKPELIEHEVIVSADYATAGNVKGLVRLSQYIVTGYYEDFEKEWNMGNNHFSEVYSFKIEEMLKGEVESVNDQIRVAIPYNQQVTTTINNKEYKTNIVLQNYSKPEIGKKYILFLSYYEPEDAFTPTSLPFQILIDDDGIAKLMYSQDEGLKTIKISENEQVNFAYERYDLQSEDKISGLKEKELIESIRNEINSSN